MNILLFNFATDPDHPAWGFAVRWIEALAERVSFVHVISMQTQTQMGVAGLPANVRVHSVGRELGLTRSRRLANFYRLLSHVLRHENVDVCFCHMNVMFGVLGAPMLKAHGVPIVTWYAHPTLSRMLKAAHWLSDRMVSSLPSAYPYKHDKLAVIGQGIDTRLFAPGDVAPESPPLVLCVGRLSPSKGHLTLIRAAALLRERRPAPFRIVALGGPAGPGDDDYVASLRTLTVDLGLQDVVEFEPPSPWTALPEWYRRSTVHVNLTPIGYGDKVAWEAMSCARPSVVANPGFGETLGRYTDDLLFRHNDHEDLARKLAAVLDLPAQARGQMGGYLREQVARLHSIDSLADKLVEILEDVRDRNRRRSRREAASLQP
jgi:glycosyltransferase involved in cell wall biosynthesis